MQEETFPAAEKILGDIENVFRKDTNLQSFEIIPVTDNANKSPVYHEENSLGLASWCIQPLYIYAYNRIIDFRSNKFRREDPSTISRWLMGALLLNPEITTFWNMRRELIRSGRLDSLQELRFTRVVLFFKAKCFEAFSYRRWLIQQILIETKNPQEPQLDPEALLRTELSVAGMSADRYANNYHAWSHREHVVSIYEALAPASLGSLLISEWEECGTWCNRHVSDHSGFAYRQYLLKRLLLLGKHSAESRLSVTAEELTKRRELILEYVKAGTRGCNDIFLLYDGVSSEVLDLLHGIQQNSESKRPEISYERVLMSLSYWVEDCKLNEELINTFPGHETLWYHRRYLAYALKVLQTSYLKFSSYTEEEFEARDVITLQTKDIVEVSDKLETEKSLLELAFASKNSDLVAGARKYGKQQAAAAEKFVKFLRRIFCMTSQLVCAEEQVLK